MDVGRSERRGTWMSVLRGIAGWGVLGAVVGRWAMRIVPPGTVPDTLKLRVVGANLGGADSQWEDVEITIAGPAGTQTVHSESANDVEVTLTAIGTYTVNVSNVAQAKDPAGASVNTLTPEAGFANWFQFDARRNGLAYCAEFRYRQ